MRVGQIVSGGIVVADLRILRKGDTFFYKYSPAGGAYEGKVEGVYSNLDAKGDYLVHDGRGNAYVPEEVFVTKQEAEKAIIGCKKRAGVGDIVYLWRLSGDAVSLVKKRICAIKNGNVQCTYLDVIWPRKEKAEMIYLSREDACADKPHYAEKLDVALFRAGQAA